MTDPKPNFSNKYESPVKISDTEGNGESRNMIIVNRDTIKEIVEPALIKACEVLYDKNIKTLESSANGTDVEDRGYAGIVVDYDSLSENNKKIVDESFGGHMTSGDDIEVFLIKIPVNVNTTTAEVEEKSLKLVKKFEQQQFTWTKVFSFKEIVESMDLAEDANNWEPEDLSEYSGYYYDKESGVFFLSQEHCEKLKKDKELFNRVVEEAKIH